MGHPDRTRYAAAAFLLLIVLSIVLSWLAADAGRGDRGRVAFRRTLAAAVVAALLTLERLPKGRA